MAIFPTHWVRISAHIYIKRQVTSPTRVGWTVALGTCCSWQLRIRDYYFSHGRSSGENRMSGSILTRKYNDGLLYSVQVLHGTIPGRRVAMKLPARQTLKFGEQVVIFLYRKFICGSTNCINNCTEAYRRYFQRKVLHSRGKQQKVPFADDSKPPCQTNEPIAHGTTSGEIISV